MNVRSAVLAVMVMLVCVGSARYGRLVRRSGRPVTPRDTVFVMALAWAVGWLSIRLPPLLDWGRTASGPDIGRAGLSLLALALAPLGLFLAAAWLPRPNARRFFAGKKSGEPHPLD